MRDRRVALKVLVEKDLRDQVQKAAQHDGLTAEEWLLRTVIACLPPAAKAIAPPPGQAVMEAAFDALDGASETATGAALPGVIPPPPAPIIVAPKPEMPVMAPSIGASTMPKTTSAVPFRGHSCVNLQPGGSGQFSSQQIQGTCKVQGGKVCHWASHVAKECPQFRPRRVMTTPALPLR